MHDQRDDLPPLLSQPGDQVSSYPVMPTAYIGFLLKPDGFFTENPANDVPPSPKKTAANGTCCRG